MILNNNKYSIFFSSFLILLKKIIKKKSFYNFNWLIVDRFFQILVGLSILVWIIRYLGPEQYGILKFSQNYIHIFTIIIGLGLGEIVSREIILKKENTQIIIGSAAFMTFIAGIFFYLICLISVAIFFNDKILSNTIVILSSLLLFKFSDVSPIFFETNLKSKYIVITRVLTIGFFSLIKIFLILTKSSLEDFLIIMVLEAITSSIIFLLILNFFGIRLLDLKLDLDVCKNLLRQCMPNLILILFTTLYIKFEQIIIGILLNNKLLGIYSAATSVTEAFYFLPAILISSLFPVMLNNKKHNYRLYSKRMVKIYRLLLILSIAIIIPVFFYATEIIFLLFGNEYIDAGPILRIHIFSLILFSINLLSIRWFIIEDKLIIFIKRSGVFFLLNIFAIIFAIKFYGIIVALIVSFLILFILNFIVDIFDKRTRRLFIIKWKSFYVFKP
jgi:O-antigen/teichoic acid export membrane protein